MSNSFRRFLASSSSCFGVISVFSHQGLQVQTLKPVRECVEHENSPWRLSVIKRTINSRAITNSKLRNSSGHRRHGSRHWRTWHVAALQVKNRLCQALFDRCPETDEWRQLQRHERSPISQKRLSHIWDIGSSTHGNTHFSISILRRCCMKQSGE